MFSINGKMVIILVFIHSFNVDVGPWRGRKVFYVGMGM